MYVLMTLWWSRKNLISTPKFLGSIFFPSTYQEFLKPAAPNSIVQSQHASEYRYPSPTKNVHIPDAHITLSWWIYNLIIHPSPVSNRTFKTHYVTTTEYMVLKLVIKPSYYTITSTVYTSTKFHPITINNTIHAHNPSEAYYEPV